MTHHHHDHDAGAPRSGRRYGFVTLLSVLIILVSVGLAAFLWFGGSTSASSAEDAARAALRTKNLAELQAADHASLTTYGWTDRAKGIVRIPVDRAIELVIPELNARAPRSAAATTPALP